MPPATRPTPVDPLVALADRCVQCGLCLPACPTYGHDRSEAESPRGRIALARAWALDTVEPGPVGDTHLDQCLGCRSCEAVCPAGVRYGELLVLARSRQRERRPTGWRQRCVEALAARPRLLWRVLDAYRRFHRVLPRACRVLPPPPLWKGLHPRLAGSEAGLRADRAGAEVPPTEGAGARGGRAGLFVGCVAGPYEDGVRAALARLCTALDIELVVPAGQTCCGSLHLHAGDTARAGRLARTNRDAFAGTGVVLTLASGCHEAVAGAVTAASRALDALDFLAGHAASLRFRECRERIALHLPCTQRNVVGSVPALRRLLAAVPGLEVVELDAGFGCCGAAGTQMLTDPARADEFRRPLLEQLAASGATRLLSANIGCRLHLAGGTEVPAQHPIEFLAELVAATRVTAHPVGGASAPTPSVRQPAAEPSSLG